MDDAQLVQKAVEWMDKNAPANQELARFRSEAAELLRVKDQPKPPASSPAPGSRAQPLPRRDRGPAWHLTPRHSARAAPRHRAGSADVSAELMRLTGTTILPRSTAAKRHNFSQ